MDSNDDISILAIAIDMKPKQKIVKKPIILANRLKVSSFNGLTLSTKINSTFFIDATFNRVTDLRMWVEAHIEELNEFTLEKSLTITPTKLSSPNDKNFTEIQNVKGRLLGRKYFWIKAKATIIARKQNYWYMSCVNCNKVSHADYGETFACIYCKYPSSKAVPRATANVQLEDTSGILIANAIGKTAEILLKHDAESLMNCSKKGNDLNIEESAQEYIFYMKVSLCTVFRISVHRTETHPVVCVTKQSHP
ncbi:unnamed protein product [Fraxinus pennsylvanica]|uniref:Replication factor A C-terminal domain-containing protein n=1 Tax=Fraxinus pennsylvanica TaxID=56036 RepID=A0AAD1Z3N2_9LAMI|nr:unnamed protein product [Fraxinus pennsylvanica]